ncbi:nucleotide pyrophosphohydrolase [Gordonia oryzae]|uniref:Nucleotide pyrophosphohydrolase n=1 Tax=Gordonia oryzae TaxID=2487349 RepID=A0A3N4GWY0_9ACTN|nr:MazG family protein [Gordonia oryzae]RPA65348.1 nucleotide pyrophosphohydrolase [Gordonia oryzae]
MTVVLLDPLRPDMIPVRARAHLSGTIYVTEDVPTTVLWGLDHFEPVFTEDEIAGTLLSTDRHHPLVVARIAQGDEVIAATIPSGSDLLPAVALMDTLRRNGPWESQQTHASLRRYLLEEAYELLDAIDAGDQASLREELGDLLLQVLFHARIAADHPTDPFDIDTVARSFTEKVSGRTPGVLSGAHADLETQIREWEERKAAEKHRGSVLDGIATTAPALALTQKVLERLTAAGYPEGRIDPAVLSVTVTIGDDSVEDEARRRTLALMSQVRAAEEQAARDGVTLDGPDSWEAVLDGTAGVDRTAVGESGDADVADQESRHEAPAEKRTEIIDEGITDEGIIDEGITDEEIIDVEVVDTTAPPTH